MNNIILITVLIMASCVASSNEPPKTFFEGNHGIYVVSTSAKAGDNDWQEEEKIGEIYYDIYPYQFADIYSWTENDCYAHSTTNFSIGKTVKNNSRIVVWKQYCDAANNCDHKGISRKQYHPSSNAFTLLYYYSPYDDPFFWSRPGWSTYLIPADTEVDTLTICEEAVNSGVFEK